MTDILSTSTFEDVFNAEITLVFNFTCQQLPGFSLNVLFHYYVLICDRNFNVEPWRKLYSKVSYYLKHN